MRFLTVSGFAFFAIAINGCDTLYLNESKSLAKVRQKKEIIVLTSGNPLVYRPTRSGAVYGIDHDLLENFSQSYGLKLKYKFYKNEAEILEALRRGEGDLAANRMRATPATRSFLSGPAYEETQLGLFCQQKKKVSHVSDLRHLKLAILDKDDQNGFSRRLQQLAPQSHLEILPYQKRTRDLIKDVAEQKYDCAITENALGQLALRYNENVEFVTHLSQPYSLHWVLSPNNYDLRLLLQAWFQKASRRDDIQRVLTRYHHSMAQLDLHDLRRFRREIEITLPLYKTTFKSAAREHRLPWQLVAAVAYQESHWNPEARSFTGVRGIMQLTTETANYLGVEDRMDPVQSIHGGSKYLRYLFRKMPSHLNDKDRLALALAAYNIGYAHLLDAQKLALRKGLNPHSWHHLREILPLLADPQYAEELEYGAARGYETVAFVERVKSFYSYMTAYN